MRRDIIRKILPLLVLLVLSAPTFADDDLLIEDFESDDYGEWKVEGKAFGPGPARGTLPGQMEVSGYRGERLVNTFYEGDGTTGTLTSPEFTIRRNYINFLVGGGGYAGKTCINLLVDGQVARTATGPNTSPGGSERLEWESWDVSKLKGESVRIRIVDQKTGTWGHINIDHIIQSDSRKAVAPAELKRTIRIDHKYLNLPVNDSQPTRTVKYMVDGEEKFWFHIKLAHQDPQFWVFSDVSRLKGKEVTIQVDDLRPGSMALDAMTNSDHIRGAGNLYDEKYRPQFHFTSRRGWLNDPNGLVYRDGTWHLFYQHNPYGIHWDNMHWGHAVSEDLFHWKELGDALRPDDLGMIFSGSAVVDENNTTGFASGAQAPLVCAYTSAGAFARPPRPFTQSLAYSTDDGRSFTKYVGNPVLGHMKDRNRDPKVFWYEPGEKWVMALKIKKHQFALFSSPNLKDWTKMDDVTNPGAIDCPEFFPLKIRTADGEIAGSAGKRWVFWGGSGQYLIGTFDGKDFEKVGGPYSSDRGKSWYAAQTWNNVPETDGRRIIIGWMRGGAFPGMPFNQQMTVPRRLTLRATDKGPRLYQYPAKGRRNGHGQKHTWSGLELKPGRNPLKDLSGKTFDIKATLRPEGAEQAGFNIRGKRITYDAVKNKLHALGKSTPLDMHNESVKLRVVVDVASIEVFANEGRKVMSFSVPLDPKNTSLKLFTQGGSTRVPSLTVWKCTSVWQ